MAFAPKIFVALPVMAESKLLQNCLDSISKQKYSHYHIYACVNQPESYRADKNKRHICDDNALCLEMLRRYDPGKITVIDHSSEGKGWTKKSGIGYARKVIMDQISICSNIGDIILSLDADTTFSDQYFRSVVEQFGKFPDAVALSNPYYHKLTGSLKEDRAVLRYEIYMRNYAINLSYIGSPYAFTALGSAIALPVSAYKAIGGMTPKLSGEDFYFLQKLKKYGSIIIQNREKVYPAARFSDRVFFGTGPAMIKGDAGDWSSYPVYHHSLFNEIRLTQNSYRELFQKNLNTPMSSFLSEQFAESNIWDPLRKNAASADQFVRACHEKVDGLRILQFLKQKQDTLGKSDEQCLTENIETVFQKIPALDPPANFKNLNFIFSSVEDMDSMRNYLAAVEETLQNNKPVL